MYQSFAILAIAALVAAVPTPGHKKGGQKYQLGPQYNSIEYDATFDDLQSLTQNVQIQQIGPYDGLDYEGIDLIQLGVDGTIVAGVIPHSSPNVGAYNTESIALQGTLKITSEYPGSVTDFFSFQQFYFGCVAGTLEAIASAPIACTITVTGYRESVQVARQKFSYNPGTVVTAPMKKVKLSKKFEYIDEVTFTTEYSVPDAGATLLDDLKYDAFSMKNGESQEEWSGKSE